VNEKFQNFLKTNNIKHVISIFERLQSNGIIEKFNGTLKDYIQKDIFATEKNEWPKYFDTYLNNYNNSYHSVIKQLLMKLCKISMKHLKI
jgi:transposase InsO family protein